MHRARVPAEGSRRHVGERVSLAAGQEHAAGEGADQAALVELQQRAGVDARALAHPDVLHRGDGQFGEIHARLGRLQDRGQRDHVVGVPGCQQQTVRAVLQHQLDDLRVGDVVDHGDRLAARVLGRGDDDLQRDLGGIGEGQQGPRHLPDPLARILQGRRVAHHDVDAVGPRLRGEPVGLDDHQVGGLTLLRLGARAQQHAADGRRQRGEKLGIVADDAVQPLIQRRRDDRLAVLPGQRPHVHPGEVLAAAFLAVDAQQGIDVIGDVDRGYFFNRGHFLAQCRFGGGRLDGQRFSLGCRRGSCAVRRLHGPFCARPATGAGTSTVV